MSDAQFPHPFPASRRKGIANGLLSTLITEARTAGAEHILLEVRASNLPATHLYTVSGFKQTGRRRDYYRNPAEDALIFAYSFSK